MIRVLCDDWAHAPRVATAATLQRHRGQVVADPGRPLAHHDSQAFENESHRNRQAGRLVLECPECGLTVTMRQDTAARLYDGLTAAAVDEVRLSTIAATI